MSWVETSDGVAIFCSMFFFFFFENLCSMLFIYLFLIGKYEFYLFIYF